MMTGPLNIQPKSESNRDDKDNRWPVARTAGLSPDRLYSETSQQAVGMYLSAGDQAGLRDPKSVDSFLRPPSNELLRRHAELLRYVGLTPQCIQHAVDAWPIVEPLVGELVDDFYAEILKHPQSAAVLTGGETQVTRLKHSLRAWIADLFHAQFDEAFVENRWMVGLRHMKIGLQQVWTAAAMCRLRDQMLHRLAERWSGSTLSYEQTASAISRLIDLDLALIQDAYYAESVATRLQHERDFAEAIIGTTEAIVLLVDLTGKILRGNTFVARLVADSRQLPPEIVSIDDLIPIDDHQVVKDLLLQACVEQPSGPVVTRLVDVRQRERTVRWFARTVKSRDAINYASSTPARLLVGHDITDLSEAQRKAVQQERLAAIGQTMTGLAHESRNAFQRSQASLETLALEVSDKPDAVALIERIQRAHDHLLHLYEEVLQFAKPVRLDLQRHHLVEIMKRTWQHICEATNSKPDTLKLTVSETLPTILCDTFATEQILRNLIENALAVSPVDAPIEVSLRETWQGDTKAVRVQIRDFGPGVKEAFKEQIFEPFFSTRPRGTGLGLPISRRLAEAHGGSLDLIPAEPGAIAVLTLPEEAVAQSATDLESRPDYRRL
ncbi:MAG: protoglobin domain-containing protein [Pirellulaceae bacterium]